MSSTPYAQLYFLLSKPTDVAVWHVLYLGNVFYQFTRLHVYMKKHTRARAHTHTHIGFWYYALHLSYVVGVDSKVCIVRRKRNVIPHHLSFIETSRYRNWSRIEDVLLTVKLSNLRKIITRNIHDLGSIQRSLIFTRFIREISVYHT